MSPPVLPFALPGLTIQRVCSLGPTLLIHAQATRSQVRCPTCQTLSPQVHSWYWRTVRDLPVSTQAVVLRLHVRRFCCRHPTCPRRTFAERFPRLLPAHAQRTARLTQTLGLLAGAVGGSAGARLTVALHLPCSRPTLLRILRAHPLPAAPTPRVLGVDDFAFRRGRVYGTVLVDLERRCPVDLLPDRTAATLTTWLQAHPGVAIVARDRSQEYARGITDGAPTAIQVADRWHLLCNLRETLERYLQRITPELRALLAPVPPLAANADDPGVARVARAGADPPTPPPPAPDLPTDPFPPPRYGRPPSRQRMQTLRQAARAARYDQVQTRAAAGQSARQIAQAVGLSLQTVRRWLATATMPPDQRGYRRGGKIDAYLPYLQERRAAGCTNQSQLWRELRGQGFRGTRSLVAKWLHAHASAAAAAPPAPPRLPAPKQLTWLVLRASADSPAEEQGVWSHLRDHAGVQEMRGAILEFKEILCQRRGEQLDGWLATCRQSTIPELRNMAAVLERDRAAVRAACQLRWSTGPVEGQVHRLKLIKRSGYGRAKLDLLRQRVLLKL